MARVVKLIQASKDSVNFCQGLVVKTVESRISHGSGLRIGKYFASKELRKGQEPNYRGKGRAVLD